MKDKISSKQQEEGKWEFIERDLLKDSVINKKKYSIERQKKAKRRALNDIQDIWRNVSDDYF